MSYVYLPANLDLASILTDNQLAFEHEEDCFHFMIGTIIRLKTINKDNLEEDYIPLNAQVMQRRIRSYNLYRDYLEERGVIEVSRHYIPGQRSMGFKLSDAYTQAG